MRHAIRRPGSIPFALLCFFLAAGCLGSAQVHVNGHVVTTDSGAVRGAVVRMRSMNDSGVTYRTQSDSLGFFSFVLTNAESAPTARSFRLHQNYPNPFSSSTTLSFTLPASCHASCVVYDFLGRKVRSIGDASLREGTHSFTWDGRDAAGHEMASGRYFGVLHAGMDVRTVSLIKTGNAGGTQHGFPSGQAVASGPVNMAEQHSVLIDVIDTTISFPRFYSSEGHSYSFSSDTSLLITVQERANYLLLTSIGGLTNFIVRIDPLRRTIVDTLAVIAKDSMLVTLLVVSKDRKKIYAACRNRYRRKTGSVFAIALQTRAISTIWTGCATDLYMAPDSSIITVGRKYATALDSSTAGFIGVLDQQRDEILIVDTLDLAETDVSPFKFNDQAVAFHPTEPLLYAWARNNVFIAYNYRSREIVREYRQTRDSEVFLLRKDGKFAFFSSSYALDLENDQLRYPEGPMGIDWTRRGSLMLYQDSLLLVSDMGPDIVNLFMPSGKILFYSTNTFRKTGEIMVCPTASIGPMVCSPDSKLVIANAGSLWFFIDMLHGSITYEDFGFTSHHQVWELR